ncbi:MAG: hypothetical protein IIY69_06880, partial [Clostridia bacterium]|nr:hypothetical protein [Clostridia bacterium]
MVISIRNVDAELRHDMERTAQMEELHRRETVYREAILANSAGFMEINLSRDEITTRIFDEEWFSRALSYPGSSFDGLSGFMAEGLILSDRREFLDFSSCQSLIECFEAQRRVVSIEFKMGTPPGGARVCIMTYYISKDKVTGDIVAVCVLYDLTRHKKRERDIKALRETLKQMRIKNFISQMHPHFLYNALRRLRLALEKAGIPELLISAARGQMVDTSLFDCDYYDWLKGIPSAINSYRGEYMVQYSWSEFTNSQLEKSG